MNERSPTRTRSALKILAGASAVFFFVTVVVLAIKLAPSTALAAAPTASPTPAVPVAVDTAPSDSTFVGVLLPPKMARLAPRADGNLIAVPVKVGQAVRQGEVLARFDPRDRKNELAMAEAQLKAARGVVVSASADFASAKQRAARRNGTVEVEGKRIPIVSVEEQSQAVFSSHGAAGRASTAAAQVAEIRARIAQIKILLDETDLRAPYDGVVTAVYFEPGMTVHATETVVRVVGKGDSLRVRIAVPEESPAVLAKAKRSRLLLDDGRTMHAGIDAISPEVDSASRVFLVEGLVENAPGASDRAMLAGRTVRAELLDEKGTLLR
jgi:RND family efflux transporter MFP subunit